MVAAGIGLTVVARLFDAVPLYVPGLAFLLIGVVVPVWVWLAAGGAGVERSLTVRRITEGERFEFELRVRYGPAPALPGAVLEPLVAEPVALAGLRGGTWRVTTSFARRGIQRIEPPALQIRDPFDLCRRVCPGTGAVQEMLVLPRTEPIRVAAGQGAGPALSTANFQYLAKRELAALAEVEIDGLRPYREGTSASRIHWAALASGAGLLERRLRAESDTRPLVVLDARGATRPEDLDAAVRAAASIALELMRNGGCALLLPGERRATSLDGGVGAWAAAHTRLALIDDAPGAPAPFLSGVGVRRGPTFYVAARRLQRLPAGADNVARAARVLVVPGVLAGRAASFEVAGCSGYELGASAGTRSRPRKVAAA